MLGWIIIDPPSMEDIFSWCWLLPAWPVIRWNSCHQCMGQAHPSQDHCPISSGVGIIHKPMGWSYRVSDIYGATS